MRIEDYKEAEKILEDIAELEKEIRSVENIVSENGSLLIQSGRFSYRLYSKTLEKEILAMILENLIERKEKLVKKFEEI